MHYYVEELDVPNGLKGLGFDSSMIPQLVEGALPQERVTRLAPTRAPAAEQLAKIFENSMTNY